jgi:hypothetical protein
MIWTQEGGLLLTIRIVGLWFSIQLISLSGEIFNIAGDFTRLLLPEIFNLKLRCLLKSLNKSWGY